VTSCSSGRACLFDRLRRHRTGGQNSRPVELHVRMLILERADRLLVESRPTDLDVWRRAEPVQQPGRVLVVTAAPDGVQEERAFVAPTVL
jgi:hypothetical protein